MPKRTIPDFDEAAHVYKLDGRKLPSVTQIIEGVMPRSFQPSAWYLSRGGAVHRAVQLAATGELDIESWHRDLTIALDEHTAGVIVNKTNAASKFLRETGYQIAETEIRLASRVHQYAGSLDAITVPKDDGPALIDWKSSIEPRVELQLGGYAVLAGFDRGMYGIAVELRDDGNYRMHLYEPGEMRRFSQEFLAVRSAYGSMEKRNLLPKGDSNGNG